MMKAEFEKVVRVEVTEEEWEIIETVYMNYPMMNKDKLYWLLKEFGMVIFKDLFPRAKKIKEIENEIINLQNVRRMLIDGEIQAWE